MSRLYTIIVTYNAMKWIDKCVDCLLHSTVHTEIVVVDNCSSDETISHISSKYPCVHLILNDENNGFGQANNQGIEYAYRNGATNFFLCNQDLYVEEHALEELLRIQSRYAFSIVSPLQLNGTFTSLDGGFYNGICRGQCLSQLVNDALINKIGDYYTVDYVPAASWMISKETVESIGGFDPIFFHYGEDFHYTNRIKYHKKRIAIVPAAKVGHDRNFKGNINAFERYSPFAVLVNTYADPNDYLFLPNMNRIKANVVIVKNITKALVTFKFKKFLTLLNSYSSFQIKRISIVDGVKINRTLGCHWLSLSKD